MNATITYLKALAIILMVTDHGMCSIPYMTAFNAMFYMPLFFIVSGYCFKDKYLTSFPTFLKRKAKGLYVPFVKYGILFALLRPLFFVLHIYDTTYGFNGVGATKDGWLEIAHSCWLIVTQMRGTDWLLGGYWFLNALFFGSIMAWGLIWLSRKACDGRWEILSGKHAECALFLSLMLFAIAHATNFHVVFLNINQRTILAAFFFVAGYTLKAKSVPCGGNIFICIGLALAAFGLFHWRIAVGDTSYPGWQIFPYMATAVIATWSFYSIFEKYRPTGYFQRFLTFTGENTLTILTWHLLSFKLATLIIICVYHLPIPRLGEFPVITEYAIRGWWMLYALVGVGLPLATTKVMDFLLQGKRSTR